MSTEKHVLLSEDYARIEALVPASVAEEFVGKVMVGFGDIGTDLDSEGFGEKFAAQRGIRYVAVKQAKGTQFQRLSRETFSNALAPMMKDQRLYF